MVLILKKLRAPMNEDKPPNDDEHQDEVNEWMDLQEQAPAIIRLSCERDQARLISDTQTGKEAWETLADTYASSDMMNVMRIEELFGRARKDPKQSMSQWIAHVKGLATQLREVRMDVTTARIANWILAWLGKEFQGVKAALRARSGRLTVEVVTQYLLSAEMENNDDNELQIIGSNATASSTTIVNTTGVQAVGNYQVGPPVD